MCPSTRSTNFIIVQHIISDPPIKPNTLVVEIIYDKSKISINTRLYYPHIYETSSFLLIQGTPASCSKLTKMMVYTIHTKNC